MGCFDDCMSGILEPYGGNMPLFNHGDTTDATVTIVQESYDDGMSVTRIQTPPRTPTCKLVDAINNVLGLMGETCMLPCAEEKKSPDAHDAEECDEDGKTRVRPGRKSEDSEDTDQHGSEKPGRFGQNVHDQRDASQNA